MRSTAEPAELRTKEIAALTACGAGLGICFLPGGPGWLCWFVFAPFFVLMFRRRPVPAFFAGWLFGAAAWIAGVHWLVAPLSAFLRLDYAAGLALFLALCAWHGLMFACLAAAVGGGSGLLTRRLGWTPGMAVFLAAAPAMTLIERFFPMLFPVYLADTQTYHLPAVQIAELTGPSGIAWLLLGFNAAACGVYLSLTSRSREQGRTKALRSSLRFLSFCVAALLLNEGYGYYRMNRLDTEAKARPGAGLRAALVQGSVPVSGGSGDLRPAALSVYRGLTREAARNSSPDLVIWPESVYGRLARFSSGGLAPDFRRTLALDLPEKMNFLLGSTAESPDGGTGSAWKRHNAAYLVSPGKKLAGSTFKLRLFPFGEFMPFGDRFPGLYGLSPGTDRLAPGAGPELMELNGTRLGVLICYEDLYSGEAAAFVRKGADILVDISNDSGFGSGTAAEQHLMLSVLRAVENRRFLLRAANTGVSAVIDPCGRVLAALAPGKRDYLAAGVFSSGPGSFYSRHPAFFLMLSCLSPIFVVLCDLLIVRPSAAGRN